MPVNKTRTGAEAKWHPKRGPRAVGPCPTAQTDLKPDGLGGFFVFSLRKVLILYKEKL